MTTAAVVSDTDAREECQGEKTRRGRGGEEETPDTKKIPSLPGENQGFQLCTTKKISI